jgi:hypothetical protein
MRTYSSSEVPRFTEATPSNVTHWLRERVIVPVKRQGRGPGHHKELVFRNLFEARQGVLLNRAGMPVSHIRTMVDHVRYVDDAAQALAAGDGKRFAQLLTKAQRYFGGPNWEQDVREAAEAWQLVKNPDTRNEIAVYAVTYSPVSGATFNVIVRGNDDFGLAEFGEAVVFINLGKLLTRLEALTDGDRLGG